MSKLRNHTKGDSNSGSLDCESGVHGLYIGVDCADIESARNRMDSSVFRCLFL